MSSDRITVFCFAASYSVAFVLELVALLRARSLARLAALGFGGAGLLAHTLYLISQRLPLSARHGSLLFLAWIVAIFSLYGTLHHRQIVWGLFVLPLILGLVAMAMVFTDDLAAEEFWLFQLFQFKGERFWGAVHGFLLLLAGVGICVAFVASIMYLVQSHRLQTKALPGHGFKLPSLERLEAMNRRGIILAFPLLTGGVIVGMALMVQTAEHLEGWTDPRVLSASVLWLVFALLLYLRYSLHVQGRRQAFLTMVAFFLLLITFAVPHTLNLGGAP